MKGTPFVIFFGFTFCPGTCPTTMLELSNVLKRLGSDADKMRYLFVSVDHERDTPEQLKLYLSNFDSRIVGLTGTAQEIAAATKGYHVYYKKIATKEGFTYNHTPLIYLMGRNGRLVNKLKYLENEEIQVEKFRKFIALR